MPAVFEIWNLNKITMKSIVKFSAKHPTMTKVIKGAGIVAATIVTTKIAESTKSGEFSSRMVFHMIMKIQIIQVIKQMKLNRIGLI